MQNLYFYNIQIIFRKYNLHYHESKTVNSIPTYGFKVEDDSYDAIKNPGYRYENFEKVVSTKNIHSMIYTTGVSSDLLKKNFLRFYVAYGRTIIIL